MAQLVRSAFWCGAVSRSSRRAAAGRARCATCRRTASGKLGSRRRVQAPGRHGGGRCLAVDAHSGVCSPPRGAAGDEGGLPPCARRAAVGATRVGRRRRITCGRRRACALVDAGQPFHPVFGRLAGQGVAHPRADQALPAAGQPHGHLAAAQPRATAQAVRLPRARPDTVAAGDCRAARGRARATRRSSAHAVRRATRLLRPRRQLGRARRRRMGRRLA
mmetsp:Transcript_50996/g.150337  ORF Transcript_50996/g.150337 Transcript_50996/m.150337 type:complete len:219 (+) Transcript_50996:2618-3274(+)